jgi:hypothetical protein
LSLPIIYTIILYLNGDKLRSKKVRGKYQNLYLDIHTFKSDSAKYYLPISMMRRVLFVLFPAIVYNYPFMQLQFFLLVSIFYLIWYGGVKPHIEKRRVRIELFNEFMVSVFIYHLMMFTDYCTSNSMQFIMGYSKIGFLVVIAFVNIVSMVIKSCEKAKRKRRLQNLKDHHLKAMQAALDALSAEKKLRVNNKERRKLVRGKLDLRAIWNATHNVPPITQKFKDKAELEKTLKEFAAFKKNMKEKSKLEGKLAKLSQSDENRLEKERDLKKRLEVIEEDLNEEKLHEIDVKIQKITTRRNNAIEIDPEIQKWKEVAEDFLEDELQEMRKNGASDDMEQMGNIVWDESIYKPYNFQNQVVKTQHERPKWGLANDEVPAEL